MSRRNLLRGGECSSKGGPTWPQKLMPDDWRSVEWHPPTCSNWASRCSGGCRDREGGGGGRG
eukprot:COSAG01_NODE_8902_length_2621_cov_1.775178_5_plen_61_part_01